MEPGDQLILTAQLERNLRGIWRLSVAATVGEAEAATAELMLAPDVANAAPGNAAPGSAAP